jgi:hypothetical protein
MRLENATIERRLDLILQDVRAIYASTINIIENSGEKDSPDRQAAPEPQAAAPGGA